MLALLYCSAHDERRASPISAGQGPFWDSRVKALGWFLVVLVGVAVAFASVTVLAVVLGGAVGLASLFCGDKPASRAPARRR